MLSVRTLDAIRNILIERATKATHRWPPREYQPPETTPRPTIWKLGVTTLSNLTNKPYLIGVQNVMRDSKDTSNVTHRRRGTETEDPRPSLNGKSESTGTAWLSHEASFRLSAVGLQNGEEVSAETAAVPDAEKKNNRWKSFIVRARAATLMMIAFGLVVWAGHMCVVAVIELWSVSDLSVSVPLVT